MIYFVSEPSYMLHRTGKGHPEQPLRTKVIEVALEEAGLKSDANTLNPRLASKEEVLLCHTPDYFQLVCREVSSLNENEIAMLSTGDVVISPYSLDVALKAAGGVLTAIDQVMTSPDSKAFCIVRPPGHHACSNAGMGFCLFNNIAIAARYAQSRFQVKRVLIVDWDVHHGNGTQEIFYQDPSVFYFSTHEKGLYPMTGTSDEVGAGLGEGTTLNCPIHPTQNSREEVLDAFDQLLRARMEDFSPDLVLISAGFDGHREDPLGHFNLTDQDFFSLSKVMYEIAQKYAKGRIVSVLEGGYNLRTLATASVAHVKGLLS